MSDEKLPPIPPADAPPETPVAPDDFGALEDGVAIAQRPRGNDYFRGMIDRNFLDYASYVIGSRAIPDVDDGLKPVQRRIMWTLYQIYDNGRTTKTANVVGNAMHYHPHGDASIGDALVVLANKGGCVERMEKERNGAETLHYINVPYFIRKEGNFGNLLTGTPAAAARYTECALTRLAYETMFNNDITNFIPNYDGREKEPTLLPAKVPSLLMLGSDGIAVGMSTVVLPHNFNELIDAEIADLRGEEFQLYPDFQQGGLMDVRDYDDGNGKITLRAKIDLEGRDLVIREIPAVCTTSSLIASIERAAEKNKIRIAGISDFTTDHAEIRITPTRGYDPEKTRQGLFMYTDCSVSVSPKLMVICDRRPVQMTVTAVLKRNVQKLLGYLRREFEIEQERLNELRHAKTLAQLFFENRIYKRIEECRTQGAEYQEVFDGLAPFRDRLLRDVTKEDVDRLLALPVRRIARFDIEKNQQELQDIAARLKEIKHHLNHLVDYAIGYLLDIKQKYGADFPRRTEIEKLEKIDRTRVALNNIKVFWDRKNGHIGTGIKSDDVVLCNEFDKLLCVERSGKYKIIEIPDKMFIGRLYDFRKYDATQEFGVIYSEKKSGKFYGKRTTIDKFITGREYTLCPDGAKLELFTPRPDAVYTLEAAVRRGSGITELNLMTLPVRSAKARGVLIGANVIKLTHQRYLEAEELAQFQPPAAAGERGENFAENRAAEERKNTSATENPEGEPAEIPIENDVSSGHEGAEEQSVELDSPAAAESAESAESAATDERESAATDERESAAADESGENFAENRAAEERKDTSATGNPEGEPAEIPIENDVSSGHEGTEEQSVELDSPAAPLVLDATLDAPPRKRARKAAVRSKATPAKAPADATDEPLKKSDHEEGKAETGDDFGIVQPEFGF